MASIRKSPARLEVLEGASAGKLEWRSAGSGRGCYILDGQYLFAEKPRHPVYQLIGAGALEHTVPGLPSRTGPIEITDFGAALLAKWKG
jgi:hypothetical protein